MKRLVLPLLCACATPQLATKPVRAPIASTHTPRALPEVAFRSDAPPVLIRNATVMTAAGVVHAPGFVLLRAGVIEQVGAGDLAAPEGVRVVDGTGKFVTPGLIDTHSHLGVFAQPFVPSAADGNEMTNPVTAEVWAEHGFWPQDPGIPRAWTGGITTIQVLPGSANLVGGRSFVARLIPATSARAMRFPGAPQGLKMACGENPKRIYGGDRKSFPMTRMGNIAGDRAAFQRAVEYRRKLLRYERDTLEWEKAGIARADAEAAGKKPLPDVPEPPEAPERNLQLETLSDVLSGKILVHNHCYRADEMSLMMDLAAEFGFRIRSFHHALEAYKIRDRLAAEGVAVSTWSDWWGFKMEALDGVQQNASMLQAAGVRTIIHSDSETEIRHLNQEAAKARTAGRAFGLDATDDEILRWVTANPAWALGIDDKVGTLEAGKRADVVVWDGSPFSAYTHAQTVLIDGHVVYDRAAGRRPSDFELWYAPEVKP